VVWAKLIRTSAVAVGGDPCRSVHCGMQQSPLCSGTLEALEGSGSHLVWNYDGF
jgi:hypothetical protein